MKLVNKYRTKTQGLQALKNNGVSIDWLFDVGFGYGTEGLFEVFECNNFIFDPTTKSLPVMESFCENHKSKDFEFLFSNLAVSDSAGKKLNFWERPGVTGSTLHGTKKKPDGSVKEVNTTTIDTIISDHEISGKIGIKIDTEGHEFQVLKGSIGSLSQIQFFIVEMSLWAGKAKLTERCSVEDIFEFMFVNNFRLYDIVEPGFRLSDDAMKQFDAIFVPENSIVYAYTPDKTPDQAKSSIEHKQKKYEAALNAISSPKPNK